MAKLQSITTTSQDDNVGKGHSSDKKGTKFEYFCFICINVFFVFLVRFLLKTKRSRAQERDGVACGHCYVWGNRESVLCCPCRVCPVDNRILSESLRVRGDNKI